MVQTDAFTNDGIAPYTDATASGNTSGDATSTHIVYVYQVAPSVMWDYRAHRLMSVAILLKVSSGSSGHVVGLQGPPTG